MTVPELRLALAALGVAAAVTLTGITVQPWVLLFTCAVILIVIGLAWPTESDTPTRGGPTDAEVFWKNAQDALTELRDEAARWREQGQALAKQLEAIHERLPPRPPAPEPTAGGQAP